MRLIDLWPNAVRTLLVLVAWSAVSSDSIAPFLTYAVVGIGLYWTHRLGHCKWTGIWYDCHFNGHHQDIYPPSRRQTAEYTVNTRDRFNLNTWMYVLCGVSLLCFLCWLRQWSAWDFILQTVLVTGLLLMENDAHCHYHVKPNDKNRQTPAKNHLLLETYHLMHHSDTPGNYAVTAVWFDVLFGTNKISAW